MKNKPKYYIIEQGGTIMNSQIKGMTEKSLKMAKELRKIYQENSPARKMVIVREVGE